jgi:hypothetical protein
MRIEAKKLEAKGEQPTASDETNKYESIDVPRPIDVLMGREKLSRSHAGTTRYQFLIGEYQELYNACETSIEKTIITSAIIKKVKDYGGRFLLRKKGETSWSEADISVVREKVTLAFRGRRRKTAVSRLKRSTDGTTTSKRRRSLSSLSNRSPESDPDISMLREASISAMTKVINPSLKDHHYELVREQFADPALDFRTY